MKIALYAHNLHQSGGLTVGRALTSAAVTLAPENRFLIAVPAERGYDALKERANVEICELSVGSYWERLKFERNFAKRLNDWNCDWAWVLGNNLFWTPQVPFSTLVQNALYLNYPLQKLGIDRRTLRARVERFCVERTVRKSRRIFGQTETVCRRLAETFGVPRSRISRCPTGRVFEAFEQNGAAVAEAARTIEGAKGKFRLLYVAAPYPHKNHWRIVETFAQYRTELRDVVCFFTFDANENVATKRLAMSVFELNLTENIVFVGTVPHSQVASCYRAADASLYPTLLETVGFGILEGMRFGLPTIVSDFDFSREICGDAAVFVDPFSSESLRDGILALKNDATFREKKRKQALLQEAKLRIDWKDCVAQVFDAEEIPY